MNVTTLKARLGEIPFFQWFAYGFVAYFFFFGYVKIVLLSVNFKSTTVYSVFMEILLVSLLVYKVRFRFPLRVGPPDALIFLYAAYGVLRFLIDFPNSALAFRLFFYPFLFYLLYKDTPKISFRDLAKVFVWFGLIMNLPPLVFYLMDGKFYAYFYEIGMMSRPGVWYYYGVPRFLSTLFSPLYAGAYLSLSALMSLYLFRAEKHSRYLLLFLFFFVLTTLTMSRGGVLNLTVGLFVFVILTRDWNLAGNFMKLALITYALLLTIFFIPSETIVNTVKQGKIWALEQDLEEKFGDQLAEKQIEQAASWRIEARVLHHRFQSAVWVRFGSNLSQEQHEAASRWWDSYLVAPPENQPTLAEAYPVLFNRQQGKNLMSWWGGWPFYGKGNRPSAFRELYEEPWERVQSELVAKWALDNSVSEWSWFDQTAMAAYNWKRSFSNMVFHYSSLIGGVLSIGTGVKIGGKSPITQRKHNYFNAFRVLRETPLGFGLGVFSQEFSKLPPFQIEDASYATILGETGIPGLFLFLLALGAMMYKAFLPRSLEGMTVIAALAGFAVHALGSSTWYYFGSVPLLFLFAASVEPPAGHGLSGPVPAADGNPGPRSKPARRSKPSVA